MARRKKQTEESDGLVEVRVVAPNIHITMPDGEEDLSPAVGDVIRVTADQVAGGLRGKVRPTSLEPKGGGALALTVETARKFLAAEGFEVIRPDDVESVAAFLVAKGYTVEPPKDGE